MKNTKLLWCLWAAMYAICTLCGFFPVASGALYGLFILLSLGFFVPPALLLFEAVQNKQPKILRIIRNLSLISLGLTLLTIVLNFVSIQASAAWGLVLYWILILVSTPMVCSQVWVIGLFGWAMLLMTCLHYLRKK
jgi:hypothetical protein